MANLEEAAKKFSEVSRRFEEVEQDIVALESSLRERREESDMIYSELKAARIELEKAAKE